MIILTQNKKLQIDSDVAELEWTVSWREKTITCGPDCEPCFSDNQDQGLTVDGEVDIIPVPTTNTNTLTYSTEVEYINVYNSTTSNATINVQSDESGTPITVFKVILRSGYNLVYNEESGWQVLDSTGSSPIPQTNDMIYATISGTDTYTATIPEISVYSEPIILKAKFTNANTGASTLNINGLGAVALVNFGNAALAANDIKAGQIHDICYDGSSFQIQSVTCNIVNSI